MRTFLVTAAILLSAILPARSQEIDDEAMEMQRCIWRCLANSEGADDPAYGACVGERCSDDQPARKKARQSKGKRSAKQSAKMKTHRSAPRPGDIIVRRIRPVYVD